MGINTNNRPQDLLQITNLSQREGKEVYAGRARGWGIWERHLREHSTYNYPHS